MWLLETLTLNGWGLFDSRYGARDSVSTLIEAQHTTNKNQVKKAVQWESSQHAYPTQYIATKARAHVCN